MNKRNWKIVYCDYSGMQKKAVELLSAEVSKVICRDKGVYTLHVLSCEKQGCPIDKNVICVGKYEENLLAQKVIAPEEIPANGYVVKVLDNPEQPEWKLAVITAYDDRNLFYGAVEFVDDYLALAAPVSGGLRTPCEAFDHKLPDYCHASFPKIETRSIFTWGHPINDYRKYIENIARQRINQLIVWNDFVPVNAKDVVDYAHEYGIELIWGFSWGWVDMRDTKNITWEILEKVKKNVVEEFKSRYNGAGDGIYFQSFTEVDEEYVGDLLIAEAVTQFVNEVAEEIYRINPDIHIQFGLHALSVKNRIEYFEKVDKRIEIVWEDCGAFPYHYMPVVKMREEFEAVQEFTDRILSLREHGRTGLVYKGMLTMDWTKFEYQSGPYVLGMASAELKTNDFEMVRPIWRYLQGEWMQNGKYVWELTRQVVDITGGKVNLCIAGQLEGGIWFPFALCAQLMWDSSESYEEILDRVSKRQCITMA